MTIYRLSRAISTGNLLGVRKLVENGQSVNEKIGNYSSWEFAMCSFNNADCLKIDAQIGIMIFLIENGATSQANTSLFSFDRYKMGLFICNSAIRIRLAKIQEQKMSIRNSCGSIIGDAVEAIIFEYAYSLYFDRLQNALKWMDEKMINLAKMKQGSGQWL